MRKISEGILYKFEKVSKYPIVSVLQKTFVSFSGLLLVSSILTLVQNLPISNFELFNGNNLVKLLSKISNIGFNYISIFVIIAFTFYYIDNRNERTDNKINHIPLALLNIAIFLTLNYSFNISGHSVLNTYINLKYFGSEGVFGALITSFITIKIYLWFVEEKIYIKLPKEVPEIISDSFLSIIPTLIIVVFWWIVAFWFNINILGFIDTLFTPLLRLGDSLYSAFIISFLNRILWFVGIHGASVINAIVSPILTVMNTANIDAFTNGQKIPYLASGLFYSNYVWIGLFPVTLAILSSKNKKLKSIGNASMIPSLFNIDEPILFGIPIILNPILLFPHILSGILPAVLSYIAIYLNIIPTPILSMPWTIPAPIKAFLATNNDIRAFIWILILWLLIYIIYLPFIKQIKKQSIESEKIQNEKDK